MLIRKFTGVDAFVAIDLSGAAVSSGPVRWARRILQSGARELARSQTYSYAALGMRRGGASGGISAVDRNPAVAAFASEAAELAADGAYLPDAAKGVTEQDLAPLRAVDPRNAARLGAFAASCDALTAAVAADSAAGGLHGRRVVIEGLGAPGAAAPTALVEAVAERGGRIVGVSSGIGTGARSLATTDGGNADELDPAALAEACATHGDGALAELAADLGLDLGPTRALWRQSAEVVFAGSKMGAVSHVTAESLADAGACRALVPCGRLAFTAKALAVCRRNGIAAVADFAAMAGGVIAAWSDPAATDAEVRSDAAATASGLMAESLRHRDGPFLGACHTAESFLSTWQDELPFGRPLAP